MDMTTGKTIAVFVIIVGCFAVLYPKIFHPMLIHAFGAGSNQNPDNMPQMPPHLRRPGPGGGRGGPPVDDIAQHMRGGPHPGMRAAAEMKKQAGATQGSGKGMMSIVLPMYAIGIVIYLIYTMTKVFGKSDKSGEEKDAVNSHFKEKTGQQPRQPQQQRQQRLLVDDDDDVVHHPQENRKKQKDLERLLMKADKDKITELEMHQLKQRLMETEAQMSRILQAMETVTDKVNVNEDQDEEATDAPPHPAPQQQKKKQRRPTKLQKAGAGEDDKSPDLDSYDFVRHSSAEQSPVMVENISAVAAAAAQQQQHNEDDEDEGEEQDEDNHDHDDYLEDIDDGEDEEEEDDEEECMDSEEENEGEEEEEFDYDPAEEEEEEEDEVVEQKGEVAAEEVAAVEEKGEDVIIGQTEEKKEEVKDEDHPDLRKRKSKQKVKRSD